MSAALLIVGASGRAHAESAARGGYRPAVIDLFGDEDTRQVAEVREVPDLADVASVLAAARTLPDGPFLFCGGLENAPDVLEALQSERTLLGIPPAVFAPYRDALQFQVRIATWGFRTPRTLGGIPQENAELGKLKRPSAGGRGIRPCGASLREGEYWQEWIPGSSRSSLFLSTQHQLICLGTTEQLMGLPEFHAEEHHYCGNLRMPEDEQSEVVNRLARVLHDEAEFRGIWGLDWIAHADGPYILELNPRPTASLEVFEEAGNSGIAAHVRACLGESVTFSRPVHFRGKAVYYAPRSFRVPDDAPWLTFPRMTTQDLNPWADLPRAGSLIPAGSPVLTLLAECRSPAEARSRLIELAAQLDRMFRETPHEKPHARNE